MVLVADRPRLAVPSKNKLCNLDEDLVGKGVNGVPWWAGSVDEGVQLSEDIVETKGLVVVRSENMRLS